MCLAKEKLLEFTHESSFIKTRDISVRVLGEIELLDPELAKAARLVTRNTAHHTSAILNICFPYTSCLEIESAVKCAVEGLERGDIVVSDVDEELLGRLMYTQDCGRLDVLVRTSGEIRLSDFMLYQVSGNFCSHSIQSSAREMIPISISSNVCGRISPFGKWCLFCCRIRHTI